MRILIAEDQEKVARNMQRCLHLEDGYVVDTVFNGLEALTKASDFQYDCIILDIMMPDLDGLTVCRELRKKGCKSPILMLTALSGSEHTVKGLDAGADDYLGKPFDMDVLTARVRALTRRKPAERSPVTTVGDITVDTNTQQVTVGDKRIELAPKEYALLEYLLHNRGTILSRSNIIEHVWGEREESLFSKTLDVHVSYVRKKLGKDLITTVPGSGYMID